MEQTPSCVVAYSKDMLHAPFQLRPWPLMRQNRRFSALKLREITCRNVSCTLHKLHEQVRRHGRVKRSAAREQRFGTEDRLFGIQAEVLDRGPSPAEAAMLADQLENVMTR